MARRTSPNTRLGGHAARIGWRQVVADPNGNREQRRAARKLGVAETSSAPGTPSPPPPDDHHTWAKPAPDDCPDCECCTERLCAQAKEQQSFCDFIGFNADFDLGQCTCVGSASARNESTSTTLERR